MPQPVAKATLIAAAYPGEGPWRRLARPAASLCLSALLLGGCDSVNGLVRDARTRLVGAPNPYVSGFVGDVVADEPRAALAARDVLARGGDAADAATTLALALSVTLPSRASLGAGGVCIAQSANSHGPHGYVFLPVAGTGAGADRPAAVPMLLRGLVALQSAQGHVQFGDLVRPVAALARQGVQVSKTLSDDLGVVAGALLADPEAAAVFGNGSGGTLGVGDTLVQPALAGTLDGISRGDGREMYTGALGLTFAAAAQDAQAGVTTADLHGAIARIVDPLTIVDGGTAISIAPAPGAGETASAYRQLESGQAPQAQGGTLPASTSFVVTDASGGAVACALTMDNLFGNGRIAPGTGIVMAASPASHPIPPLPAAIARRGSATLGVVAASGQADAAVEAAAALFAVVHGNPVTSATAQGHANVIACPSGGTTASCTVHTDPRASGLGLTSG